MNQNQSKEVMINLLRPNASQSFKIKKLTSVTRVIASNAGISSEDDMEYEETPGMVLDLTYY